MCVCRVWQRTKFDTKNFFSEFENIWIYMFQIKREKKFRTKFCPKIFLGQNIEIGKKFHFEEKFGLPEHFSELFHLPKHINSKYPNSHPNFVRCHLYVNVFFHQGNSRAIFHSRNTYALKASLFSL